MTFLTKRVSIELEGLAFGIKALTVKPARVRVRAPRRGTPAA